MYERRQVLEKKSEENWGRVSFCFGSPPFASRTPAQFTTAGNMITPRAAHTATLLRNGKVLITGGLSKGNPPGAAMVPGTCGARLYADTAGKEAQFPLTPFFVRESSGS